MEILAPNTVLQGIMEEPEPPIVEPLRPGFGRLRCISSNGDDRIVWDRRFLDQVKEARAKFLEMIGKGWRAFVVKENGERTNRQIFKFNPNLEEVVMLPPIVAG